MKPVEKNIQLGPDRVGKTILVTMCQMIKSENGQKDLTLFKPDQMRGFGIF